MRGTPSGAIMVQADVESGAHGRLDHPARQRRPRRPRSSTRSSWPSPPTRCVAGPGRIPVGYLAGMPGFRAGVRRRCVSSRRSPPCRRFRGRGPLASPDAGPDEEAVGELVERHGRRVPPRRHRLPSWGRWARGSRQPHWYLPLIGVDPLHQSKGWGTALLQYALDQVDREHLPAYLESSNPRNIPLYQRHRSRSSERSRPAVHRLSYPCCASGAEPEAERSPRGCDTVSISATSSPTSASAATRSPCCRMPGASRPRRCSRSPGSSISPRARSCCLRSRAYPPGPHLHALDRGAVRRTPQRRDRVRAGDGGRTRRDRGNHHGHVRGKGGARSRSRSAGAGRADSCASWLRSGSPSARRFPRRSVASAVSLDASGVVASDMRPRWPRSACRS